MMFRSILILLFLFPFYSFSNEDDRIWEKITIDAFFSKENYLLIYKVKKVELIYEKKSSDSLYVDRIAALEVEPVWVLNPNPTCTIFLYSYQTAAPGKFNLDFPPDPSFPDIGEVVLFSEKSCNINICFLAWESRIDAPIEWLKENVILNK